MCVCVYLCVYVCVCMHACVRLLPPGYYSMMWHDMDPIKHFYMAAVVGIVSRRGLRVEACCRNHSNKTYHVAIC